MFVIVLLNHFADFDELFFVPVFLPGLSDERHQNTINATLLPRLPAQIVINTISEKNYILCDSNQPVRTVPGCTSADSPQRISAGCHDDRASPAPAHAPVSWRKNAWSYAAPLRSQWILPQQNGHQKPLGWPIVETKGPGVDCNAPSRVGHHRRSILVPGSRNVA